MTNKTVGPRPDEPLNVRLRYCLDMLYIHDLITKEEVNRVLEKTPHLRRGPE